MKPRLCLITPPYHCGVVEVAGRWLPLNLLYIADAARRAGVEPTLYDAMSRMDSWDEIRQTFRREQPHFVASYAITATINDCMKMGRILKEEVPRATYILGGVHPTFMWQEILEGEDCPVDFVVRGEGEITMEELLRALTTHGDFTGVKGISYRGEDGRAKPTPARPLMDDLEQYHAAYDLPDWDIYKYFVIPDGRLAAVDTSRGCNFTCTFCSQQIFWNKSWRARSPQAVVEDIRHLYDERGANVILFTDEYPTQDPDRWEEILDRVIALKRDLYILLETRAPDIVRDKAILKKYRQAGIVHVYVGLEATDQATLDLIGKDASVEEGRESLQLIREFGMLSETSFVLGFPHETEDTIKKTLELSKYFNPDMAHYLAITPWPYAELYAEMKEHIEVTDYSLYNLIEPIIKPINMTMREIDEAIIRCYRDFYMPKMTSMTDYPDEFRRQYMKTSMKLIMKSSFIVQKMAKLLPIPKAMKEKMGL